jgi:hypothetical protein
MTTHATNVEPLKDLPSDLSLKDLVVIAPSAASIFAFAYVIGYFYAFDISWFAFFTFSEHLVFALRALPMAVGASVGLLIALHLSQVEHQWQWLKNKNKLLYAGWRYFLVFCSVLSFLSGHFGMGFTFLVVFAGVYIHRNISLPRPRFTTLLYWSINLIILTLIAGFISGNVWRIHKWLPLRPDTFVVETNISEIPLVSGRVIFFGKSGVLIYDHALGGVRLIRPENVKAIYHQLRF